MSDCIKLYKAVLYKQMDRAFSVAFNLHNRKYLGSKYRLLGFITDVIRSKIKNIGIFIDGFAGTGVVGYHFRKFAGKIISNDTLLSSYIICRAFMNSTRETVCLAKVMEHLNGLNNIQPLKGYMFKNYGGTYFTKENAGLIDAIRERIKKLHLMGECSVQEKYILLTSLLFAADKAANTVGQYDAFLKHIENVNHSKEKHLTDSNVHKRILLKYPDIIYDDSNEVYNEDLNVLIKRINGDVLYLDPPYNSRQYIDCYHVLENLVRWDKPVLYGKTKKFCREQYKSRYSRKTSSAHAFSDLIAAADVKHIFLSYNTEGIIPDETILGILSAKGRVEIFEEDYPIFGCGAGKAVKRPIKERIFYCRVS